MRKAWVLALALAGCDDAEDHHHEESQTAIGCDHFEYGDDLPRTATFDAPGAEATLAAVHQRYVVTLPTTEGTEGALLAFIANESGDFYLMLGSDVPLALLKEGAEVAATEVIQPVSDCAAAAVVHVFEDLAAGSYQIRLGPTTATEVTLVPHLAGQQHTH